MGTNPKLKFSTVLLTAGKTATGIKIPDEIIEKLNGGKKPLVKVTINNKDRDFIQGIRDQGMRKSFFNNPVIYFGFKIGVHFHRVNQFIGGADLVSGGFSF